MNQFRQPVELLIDDICDENMEQKTVYKWSQKQTNTKINNINHSGSVAQ